ncbi:hypothetical protein T484DRAFT_1787965 [Baffinella frigidus]|nr:hypothetical protein T484DRAFT_1787965 [Cryptophyta sp. CCMP2293]
MLPATRLALLLAALVPIAGGGGIDTLLTSSGLRLAIVASKGRGVAATKAFARGDRVLLEDPLAFALSSSDDAHATHCHTTLQAPEGKELGRCAACKFARYSDRDAQVQP